MGYSSGDCMTMLLEYGANPALKGCEKRCPFIAAADEGNAGWHRQTLQLKYALFCKFGVKRGNKARDNALQRIIQNWKDEKQPKRWVQFRLRQFDPFTYGWMTGGDRLRSQEPPEIKKA